MLNCGSQKCGTIFRRVEDVTEVSDQTDSAGHAITGEPLPQTTEHAQPSRPTFGPENNLKRKRADNDELDDLRKFRRLRILSGVSYTKPFKNIYVGQSASLSLAFAGFWRVLGTGIVLAVVSRLR
jgi:hypothetical protein